MSEAETNYLWILKHQILPNQYGLKYVALLKALEVLEALAVSRTAPQACIGCGTTGPLVGFTFEHQPGPFCCVCWKALKTSFIELDADEALRTAQAPQQATQSWAVNIERNGESVVTLSSNMLAGRDLSDEDERVIRMAGEHLLAFIGSASMTDQTDLAVAQARIQVLETSVDYLRYLVDHPVKQWLPIASAPTDGTEILITDGEWIASGGWEPKRKYWWSWAGHGNQNPTHWMPLPVAPAEGEALQREKGE